MLMYIIIQIFFPLRLIFNYPYKSQTDPRTSADSRINMRNNGVDARATVNNISNVDPRTFIDPRSFNGLNRNQSANNESSTSRDPRLNSNSPTPRLNSDSRTGPRLV